MNASGGVLSETEPIQPPWGNLIAEEEWSVCQIAISALRAAGVKFLVGGAFGLAVYTGRLRNTKDMDFFVVPAEVPAAIEALSNAGFIDYYSTLPYDRGWIYRSIRNRFIIDIIFKMANQRADVDSIWFERARDVLIRGEALQAIPPEELLWQKLYVLQRDRCDWPDILNLLFACGLSLDWDHLFWRLEDDLPLLRGILNVFEWLCPEQAAQLPSQVRAQLRLGEHEATGERAHEHRVRLLDIRDWFVADGPSTQTLEV